MNRYGPNNQPPYYQPPPPQRKWYMTNFGIVVMLVLFFPIGLFLMWRYARWDSTAKWIVTAIFAVLVVVYGITNNGNQGNTTTNEQAKSSVTHQGVITPMSTPTPKPTEPPTQVLFDQSNQSTGLSFADSSAFSANGALKIEYACAYSVKDGVDVQMNLVPVDADGTVSIDRQSWMVKLSCPLSGQDTFTANGEYKVTVATPGNVGWTLKISQ